MKGLIEGGEPLDSDLPDSLRVHLARTAALPGWADRTLIETRPCRFRAPRTRGSFPRWRAARCRSATAARNHVQALALTARLYNSPTSQAIDVLDLAIGIFRPGGLEPGPGPGIRAIQRVRLANAALRRQIGHYPGWRVECGTPLNQQDMAVTLASYSALVLDGLGRLGLELSAGERGGATCTAGQLRAICSESCRSCWPTMPGGAMAFATGYAAREAAASPEGRYMTAALMAMLQHFAPGQPVRWRARGAGPLLPGRIRGPTCWEWRHYRPAALLLEPIEEALGEIESGTLDLDDTSRLHEIYSRVFVEGLRWTGRGLDRTPFHIPAELRRAWGITPPEPRAQTAANGFLESVQDAPDVAQRRKPIPACHEAAHSICGVWSGIMTPS